MSFIDHVRNLTGGTRFAGADLRQWRKPVVYLFVKDSRPLYVGYSRKGISRMFADHKQAALAQDQCDEVMVWPLEPAEDARRLEQILIFKLKPVLNVCPQNPQAHKILGISKNHSYTLKKRA